MLGIVYLVSLIMCTQGAVESTTYEWNFNDSTNTVVKIGLDNSQGLMHAFSSPGVYTVTVTASNIGGSSDTEQVITVYGECWDCTNVLAFMYLQ